MKRYITQFRFLLVACMLVGSLGAFAQAFSSTTMDVSYDDGISLYTFTSPASLLSTGQDDVASTVTNIGFDFWLNGTKYTQFSASSNGLMRLGSTTVTNTGTNSLAATGPLIAPYWNDLTTGNNGYVQYELQGTAPSRRLVVEWFVNQRTGAGIGAAAVYKFQAVLRETTNEIWFTNGVATPAAAASTGYSYGIATSSTNYVNVNNATPPTVTWGASANNLQTSSIPAGREIYFTPSAQPTAPSSPSCTVNSATQITFSWTDASTNELGYEIYYSTNSAVPLDGTSSTNISVAANTTSRAITGLCPNVTYYFKVFARKEALSAASAISNCTSSCTAPTLQASSVTNSLVTTKTATASWTRGNGANVLVVVYPGTTAGTAPTSGTAYTASAAYGSGTAIGTGYVVYSGTAATVNITNLTRLTDYIVVAYEFNGTGCSLCYNSATTATTTFTTLGINDECSEAYSLTSSTTCSTTTGSTLLATTDVATGVCAGTNKEAVWYKFTAVATAHRVTAVGAAGINLKIGAISTCGTTVTPTGGACVDVSASAGTETLNLTGLTIGDTYYVNVLDINGVNQASAFTICVTHFDCTSNTSPSDGAFIVNTATLTWNAVTMATSYDVYIGTSAATATLRGNVATNSYTGLLGLGLAAGTYYWYVVPKNASGAATGCSSSATSFVLTVPSCPSLTSPTASQIVTTYKPTFTWVASVGATSYDVYLGSSVASATLLANTASTSYTTTVTLTAGTSYYWYVVAKNSTGSATGCSSNARLFTTMSLGSTTCASLAKLCTQAGQTLSFGATTGAANASSTNSGNAYGCLTQSPSPSWFYIEMATAGKLDITLQGYDNANNTVDNDFILYGPFASIAAAQAACNTYTLAQRIDCSYASGIGSESINIPTTATVGQVYVLLVTAYSPSSSYFTLKQEATSVGSTVCSGVVGVCNLSAMTLANISACNDNGTTSTADDYYMADVLLTFASAPATGTLDLSGAGIHSGTYSVSVGSTSSSTTHTFTGVKILANGSASLLKATFSANTGCSIEKSFTAVASCSSPCAGKTFDYVGDSQTAIATGYCDDGTWNHYYDPANPTKLLFSINKNGLTFSPSAITVRSRSRYFAQDANTPALTSWIMNRTWNVEVTADAADDFDDVTHKFTRNGTDGSKNVKVRFYYKPTDKTNLQTALNTFMNNFASGPIYQERSLWFKNNDGTALNLDNIVEGRGIQNSVELTALDNQTTNNLINYVELSGIDGFSGGGFGTGTNPDPCPTCSPLPITLTSFTAVNNGASNKILWETASEQNTEWHVIEKSSDGIRFNDLGKVAAAGNSTSSKEYNMLDNTPFSMTYYRLRTIDFDGTVSHSAIVAVKRYVSNFDLVEVFPNPTDNLINARLTSSGNEEVSFKVVDALGRVVYQADKKLTSGSNTISIETSNFERAVYYLHITNSERNITVPFSKK